MRAIEDDNDRLKAAFDARADKSADKGGSIKLDNDFRQALMSQLGISGKSELAKLEEMGLDDDGQIFEMFSKAGNDGTITFEQYKKVLHAFPNRDAAVSMLARAEHRLWCV